MDAVDLMQRLRFERERVQLDADAGRVRLRPGPEHAWVDVALPRPVRQDLVLGSLWAFFGREGARHAGVAGLSIREGMLRLGSGPWFCMVEDLVAPWLGALGHTDGAARV